jgi:putative hydrolase of the HAD superfamily
LIEAVTFDLWDTLVYMRNYGEFRLLALNRLLMVNGIFLDDDELNEAYMAGWRHSSHVIRTEGNRHVQTAEIVDRVLSEVGLVDPPNRDEIVRMYEEAVLMDPPRLKEGVTETLAALHGRYRLGLVSVTGVSAGRLMRGILERQRVLGCFEALAFSDEVGYVKPDPRLFMAALEELGVEPEKAAHVGDSVKSDVFGAKNAGMKTVWLKTRDQAMVADPDRIITRLTQLPETLKTFHALNS